MKKMKEDLDWRQKLREMKRRRPKDKKMRDFKLKVKESRKK